MPPASVTQRCLSFNPGTPCHFQNQASRLAGAAMEPRRNRIEHEAGRFSEVTLLTRNDLRQAASHAVFAAGLPAPACGCDLARQYSTTSPCPRSNPAFPIFEGADPERNLRQAWSTTPTREELTRAGPPLFQCAPVRLSTTGTVLSSICRSSPKLQLWRYAFSNNTTCSKSRIKLRPAICHGPVIPGRTSTRHM